MSKKNDLKKQIKEMEDKARAEVLAKQASLETVSQEPQKVSFDQWWISINSRVSLKPYMKEILLADFKARGVSKSETLEKYDETLRTFGISVP
jgi:hypothetical protein